MKRILLTILMIAMSFSMMYGCKKQTLPTPEYPLSAEIITEALQEWEISYTLTERDFTMEGQRVYTLSNEKSDWPFLGISSGRLGAERLISITFDPFYSVNSISLEDCEEAIVFATSLFGGFENACQVYNSFASDYDTRNTVKTQYDLFSGSYPSNAEYLHEGESVWESNINGITCRISLEQPRLENPEEYIRVIAFSTDMDLFFPELDID